MTRIDRTALAWILVVASVLPAHAADVPSPETHLGYQPGADLHLAEWGTVVDYVRKVDAASDRVRVRELGRTTEGRPYLVAAVSTPTTLANLEKYQRLQRRLTDPRTDSHSGESSDPVAESKAVVVITCSIHSNETASTFMAMELLHELATKDDSATREILENTILLLVPSANPDGVDKVAKWYERTKGQPWEGAGMPELYHVYAGHDTNRDWFMLNLAETRLLTHMLYKEWFPTILYDVHQMGSRGARLFVPPFFDPINPNLDARLNQSIFLIGAHMATDLAAADKRGVLTNAMYDNWWNGGNRTTPQRHNIVAVLTEAASVRMATPIFLEKGELRGGARGFNDHSAAVNFVDPWPGGWWRLRDIVDYEKICARSLLTLAAKYKEQFQTDLRVMGRDAIEKGKTSPPFAWIVPSDQRDLGTASKMIQILHDTGIEVRRASTQFQAEGVGYPAGTWILPAAQPYRAHLKDMMERQVYPSRFTAKGEAETPYDVAGWTLPLQMGVRAVAVSAPFDAEADAVEVAEPTRGTIQGADDAKYYWLSNRSNDDFLVLNALLDAGIETVAAINFPLPRKIPEGFELPPVETFRFPADATTKPVLAKVLPRSSSRIVAEPVALSRTLDNRSPKLSRLVMRKQKIGLYQPWIPSMDEGWTRLVLERFGFAYETLHNTEIRADGLKNRIDALLIPSIDTKTLREGFAPNESEPQYVGGLGQEGVAALRDFVQTGGTLVCLEDSCEFVIEELGLPVANVVKGLKTADFYAPGSIVRVVRSSDAATSLHLTFGVPDELSVYFDHSLAFDVRQQNDSPVKTHVVLSYAKEHPLESGWLLGPEKIQGKAALVEVSLGKGHVVLFGFPPQHRGQTHGTFRLLFNALLRGEFRHDIN